jgi:sulfatase maturation enzyme AslB (radical SAM superfamily)
MRLLEQFLPRTTPIRVRPADHIEEQDGLVLQVWGDEGYWQVVDREFRDFLQAAEQPTSLESILEQHPEWSQHRRSILAQLGNMKKAGLLGTPRKPAPPPKIENLTINLTTGCNLSCQTCYVPRETRTPAKLDVRRLLTFLDDLRSCFSPAATLGLLGGEPFLHAEGVLGVGRWAKRHKFICNVSTNGTLLPEALLRGLADAGLKVQVSLDGATAATNDAIRGAETFEKATATVGRLVGSGVPTTLGMVCCRENLAEVPDYFWLARHLGAEQVRFIPLKKLGNGKGGTVTRSCEGACAPECLISLVT